MIPLTGQDMIYYLAIIAAIGLAVYFLLETSRRPKEPETETKELLKCIKCGYTIEKEYSVGDFIGLVKDKCPKCGSPLKIIAIYDVVKKTPEKTLKPPKQYT